MVVPVSSFGRFTGRHYSPLSKSVGLLNPVHSEDSGDGKMLIRPRKSRIYYDHSFFDYPLTINMKTIRNFGIRKIARIGGSYFDAKIFPIKR